MTPIDLLLFKRIIMSEQPTMESALPQSDMPGDNDSIEISSIRTRLAAKKFGSPFDAEDADVVLRSSEGIDFHVHKLILSLASPVFQGMFTIPQPQPDEPSASRQDNLDQVDGLPMVQMSEATSTLQHLLTAVYPLPTALPSSFEKTVPVLSAAKKFEMTGTLSAIRAAMHASGMYNLAPERALRAYGLACSHGLEEEALTAALHTLAQPMNLETYGRELRYVSGAALFELMQYRQRCVTAVLQVLKDSVLKPSQTVLALFPQIATCKDRMSRTNPGATKEAARWWKDYWRAVSDAVKAGSCKPTAQKTVDSLELYKAMSTHARESSCRYCSEDDTTSIKAFTSWMSVQITIATRLVKLTFEDVS